MKTSDYKKPGEKIAEGTDKVVWYKGHLYDKCKGKWRYLY